MQQVLSVLLAVLLCIGFPGLAVSAEEGDPAGFSVQEGEITTMAAQSVSVTLDGRPVSYVFVKLYQSSTSNLIGSVHTDSSGVATFPSLPSSGSGYFLVVTGNSYSYVDYTGLTFSLPGALPPIALDSGISISGNLSFNGNPVSSQSVYLHQVGTVGHVKSTYTSSTGDYRFSMIPPGNNYYLYVSAHTGNDFLTYDGSKSGAIFSLPGSAPGIVLKAGNSVSGTLTFNGLPLANRTVYLREIGSDGLKISNYPLYTDSNGNFSMNKLPDGQYQLVVKRNSSDEFAAYTGEVFSLPGTVPSIQLEAGITITSKVTFNGLAANDVYIYLMRYDENGDGESVDGAASSVDGTVVFRGVAAGSRYFFESNSSSSYLPYKGAEFSLPGSAPATIALKSGRSISTRVTFQGAPVAGLEVALRQIDPFHFGEYGYATTDSNGVATFSSVPDGTTNCYFVVTNGYNSPYAPYDGERLRKTFSVPGVVPSIELVAGYTVTARILKDGVAQSDISVRLMEQIPTSPGSYQTVESQKSRYDGTVTFTNVPGNNSYGFVIESYRNDYDFTPYDSGKAGTIFSVAGDTVAPDILVSEGNTVTTTITLNGAPISGVKAYVHGSTLGMYRGNGGKEATSDASGNVTFKNIADDDRSFFRVIGREGSYAAYNSNLMTGAFSVPSSSYSPIELVEGIEASVQFTYKGQSAVDTWAHILAKNASGEFISIDSAVADSNGIATFKNIPPGYVYTIGASYEYSLYQYVDYEGTHEFTLPGVIAPIELYQPGVVTPPTGSGNSSSGSKGGGGGGGGRTDPSTTTTAASSTLSPLTAAQSDSLVDNALKQAAGVSKASVTVKNTSTVALSVFQSAAKKAKTADKALTMNFDQLSGNRVTLRLSLDPAKATKDLDVSLSTTSAQAKKVQGIIDRWFSNKTFVVSAGQKGSYGQAGSISVLLPKDFDTKDLHFYTYDSEKKQYVRLENTAQWVDQNGYLHFTTTVGGDIVVSAGKLTKK